MDTAVQRLGGVLASTHLTSPAGSGNFVQSKRTLPKAVSQDVNWKMRFGRKENKRLKMEREITKHYKVTIDSRHSYPVAPNLLDRQSEVDTPNTVWTADITYILTLEGWSYPVVVMDL
ncbi:MAG: hypothetical protein SWO11_18710, partial [Thermodesulfobacteriota bacterium]|nr:hypothetical protein [Thermodesulfobacteriota bacterium]